MKTKAISQNFGNYANSVISGDSALALECQKGNTKFIAHNWEGSHFQSITSKEFH